MLAELEKKAEQARAGILSTVEGTIAAHMQRPVEEHVEDWIASLEARRVHVDRIFAYRHRLKLVFEGCSVHRIGDLEAPRVERWLISRREAGLTASEWNEIRSALTAFTCSACARTAAKVELSIVKSRRAAKRTARNNRK